MKRLFSFQSILLLISIAGVFSLLGANVLFCNADNVNIRAKPDTAAEILGTLAKNDSIVVVDEQGDWYKLDYNDSEVWANKKFFNKERMQLTTFNLEVQRVFEQRPRLES